MLTGTINIGERVIMHVINNPLTDSSDPICTNILRNCLLIDTGCFLLVLEIFRRQIFHTDDEIDRNLKKNASRRVFNFEMKKSRILKKRSNEKVELIALSFHVAFNQKSIRKITFYNCHYLVVTPFEKKL
jgi:hypothetical protein